MLFLLPLSVEDVRLGLFRFLLDRVPMWKERGRSGRPQEKEVKAGSESPDCVFPLLISNALQSARLSSPWKQSSESFMNLFCYCVVCWERSQWFHWKQNPQFGGQWLHWNNLQFQWRTMAATEPLPSSGTVERRTACRWCSACSLFGTAPFLLNINSLYIKESHLSHGKATIAPNAILKGSASLVPVCARLNAAVQITQYFCILLCKVRERVVAPISAEGLFVLFCRDVQTTNQPRSWWRHAHSTRRGPFDEEICKCGDKLHIRSVYYVIYEKCAALGF